MNRKIGIVSILFLVLIFLAGCQKNLKISDGVKFFYTGYFSDGSVFETGEKTITLGSGEVPKFMETALMNPKGEKNIKLEVSPADAYGPLYESGKLQKIARFIFDKMLTGFVVGEKKKIFDVEGVIKGIEIMDGNEYVLFEMNPKQTWDVLKYEIQILDK